MARATAPIAVPSFGATFVEPVGKPHAAATFHVLRQDDRIARDVLAEMAGDHAGIEIVATADTDV